MCLSVLYRIYKNFINGSLAAGVATLIDATPTWQPSTTAGASSFDYFLTIRAVVVGVELSSSEVVSAATTPYIATALELTWPKSAEELHLIRVGGHTFAKH